MSFHARALTEPNGLGIDQMLKVMSDYRVHEANWGHADREAALLLGSGAHIAAGTTAGFLKTLVTIKYLADGLYTPLVFDLPATDDLWDFTGEAPLAPGKWRAYGLQIEPIAHTGTIIRGPDRDDKDKAVFECARLIPWLNAGTATVGHWYLQGPIDFTQALPNSDMFATSSGWLKGLIKNI